MCLGTIEVYIVTYIHVIVVCRAQDNYEKVKAQYGATSCYLLRINSIGGGNSSPVPAADLWLDRLGPREQGEVRSPLYVQS